MSRVPTGKELLEMTKETFQTDNVTAEQLSYVMDMQRASSYALRNHTIRGRPMTFFVPGRNPEKEHSHRPWQVQMLNETHPNLAIIKSRQLGLSEIGVLKLLHFLDTHSFDRVKALYAFPK